MPPRKRARPKAPSASTPEPARGLEAWFAERGWTPFAFQREAWAAYARGESGLIHVPTGAGKTLVAQLAMRDTPRSTLICVPTLDLMHQWYSGLLAAFPDVDMKTWCRGSGSAAAVAVAAAASTRVKGTSPRSRFIACRFSKVFIPLSEGES